MSFERILGLVDAENLYYTPREKWGPGSKVDFSKLYQMITGGYKTATVINYLVADPIIDQTRFLSLLRKVGYTVKIKVLYSKKEQLQNSNWDPEIIEDGMAMIHQVDHLVLVSGDGGFSDMIRRYQELGKRTSVICFEDDFSSRLKVADTVTFLNQRILMSDRKKQPLSALPECRFPMR